MADTKISDLSAVTDLIGTDEYVLARAGATKKIDASDLASEILALGGTGSVGADGWTTDSDTWTYASASTFTVSGDVEARFAKGTRIKFTQTTVKYAVVLGAVHVAGTTTVTIGVNLTYTIANAAISATYYSYQASPQGYPSWFPFTPTYTGFSSPPAAGSLRYAVIGNMITIAHIQNTGTSNTTGFTMTVPAVAVGLPVGAARTYNNSTFPAAAGFVSISTGTAVADILRDGAAAAWTASNLKTVAFELTYEF